MSQEQASPAMSSVTPAQDRPIGEPVPKRSVWMALVVIAMAISIIIMDGTIVDVALPKIMVDLKLSFTSAEWIVTLYSLVFASLLITFGRIADHIGRKKMMIAGVTVFAIGAIVSALANGLWPMLAGRFVQGVGGAMIMPTTVSSINALFKGKKRIIAFATYGTAISVAAAAAPVIGGLFTTYSTWRWIFWFDVIWTVLVIALAAPFLPETFGEKINGRFDFWGFILSVIAFSCIVYGLIDGKNYGWWHADAGTKSWWGMSRIFWILLVGVIALIGLIWLELALARSGKSRLMSLELFKYRSFWLGDVIDAIGMIGEYGLVFLLPLYLQNVLGLSALQTGVILCVMGGGAFFSGGSATPFVKATNAKTVVFTGFLIEAISMGGFFFTIRPDSSHTGLIYLWLALYGVGLGFASAQLTSVAMVDIPDSKAGQASSMMSTVGQLGSALAIAVIGTCLVSFLWAALPAKLDDGLGLPEQAAHGISTAVIDSAGSAIPELKASPELNRMPRSYRAAFGAKLDEGFTAGVTDTIGVASCILLAGAVCALFLPAEKKRKETEEQAIESTAVGEQSEA